MFRYEKPESSYGHVIGVDNNLRNKELDHREHLFFTTIKTQRLFPPKNHMT
jgi:hypothetical protein